MQSKIKKITPDSKNPEQGHGFIFPTDEGRDYYFNHFDLTNIEYKNLREGMVVEFKAIEIEKDNNRKASEIALLDENLNEQSTELPISYNGTINQVIEILSLAARTTNSEIFEDIVF